MSSPMISSLIVRPLQARDEPGWRRLWQGYLDFYEAVVAQEATDHTWRRMLDPTGAMFGRIAVMPEAPVGFAIGIVHDGTWSMQPTCYLEDLFVDPAVRGAGVGRALLDHLVALGGKRGWSSLYWHTRVDNARARRLYDRYALADGFVRYRLAMAPQASGSLTLRIR